MHCKRHSFLSLDWQSVEAVAIRAAVAGVCGNIDRKLSETKTVGWGANPNIGIRMHPDVGVCTPTYMGPRFRGKARAFRAMPHLGQAIAITQPCDSG
ncbi:hypothetical protein GCM10010981_11190 [Dyella nitratireducens]|uniref:Uncharacterized protein n=1 Tax=Dyella nitratireducens TaxID=1849580 RepID=A0ABQ1FPB3_9GAMM|nr:hypothetical protein GCM10010981_11190 [Dyella nitratireducens]GLQ43818.1 hypothetical protein GCM10007902_36680 [Dyella nitratireducens]